MKLVITDNRKIFALQEEFNKMFPYLKLQFFGKPSKAGGIPSKKLVKYPSHTVGECRTVHKSGSITVTPQMTVGELEQTFRDEYDLAVEVFRKSGKAWLGTSATDDWTLERQNRIGAEMEISVSEEITEGNPPMTEDRS